MNKMDDQQFQDLLNNQENWSGLESNSPDLEAYKTIYAELKEDSHISGAPMGFTKKVNESIFLASEKRSQKKWYLINVSITALVAVLASLVFYFYDVSFAQLSGKYSPLQIGAFVVLLIALYGIIQTADRKWVQKSNHKY